MKGQTKRKADAVTKESKAKQTKNSQSTLLRAGFLVSVEQKGVQFFAKDNGTVPTSEKLLN
jgi:hypothetical protein